MRRETAVPESEPQDVNQRARFVLGMALNQMEQRSGERQAKEGADRSFDLKD